jgi:HSP20 family protein
VRRDYDGGMARRRDLDWLRDEMDELFADLARTRRRALRRGFSPAVDVYRSGDPPAVTVTVDLAGVDPADIELGFAEGILTIAGQRRRAHGEGALYQQMELDHGAFERAVRVGDDVDPARAEATYDRGLLTIRLPLLARPTPPVRVVISVVRDS